MPDLTIAAAVAIFVATYAVVAVGKIPVYRIDRAGAALGVEIGFWSYFKIGAPLTLITILIALLWL